MSEGHPFDRLVNSPLKGGLYSVDPAVGGTPPPPPLQDNWLQQDGNYWLQQNGDFWVILT